jgi:creatinine amidohydrolase
MKRSLLLVSIVLSITSFSQKRNPANKAVYLEDISWASARELLSHDDVIVIPLGAGSKEHGPHLPLSTDLIQAEGLARLVALQRKVIITPVVNYGFYPAFLKYPGSTSTNFRTATDMVMQIIRGLAAYGPKRFYIINVGVSTTPTLELAAKTLAEEGILLYYSRYDRPAFERSDVQFRTKEFSGHADEIETSNILYLRGDLVDMRKAVNDSSMKDKRGNMAPVPIEGGNLNTSGINGYAALGTKEKGEKSLRSFANALINEIDSISNCALPVPKDRTAEYSLLEGSYTDVAGKKLVISQKNNTLYFVWDGRDARNFFHLYKDGPDYFSSIAMNLLFVKNEKGIVEKAWCQLRGESFWMIKDK